MEHKFVTYDRNIDKVPEIVNGQKVLEMDGSHPIALWIDQDGHRYPAAIAGGKVQPYFAGHEVAADRLILGNGSVGSAPPADPKTGQIFFQFDPLSSQADSSVFIVMLDEDKKTSSATLEEILAARAQEKIVVGRIRNNREYLCVSATSSSAFFFSVYPDNISFITVYPDQTWTSEILNYLWPTGEAWNGHAWRNGTFRGRTIQADAKFYCEIAHGTFDNIFLGDRVKLGNHYYLVAGFNTYPSIYSKMNHLVLVSRYGVGTGAMSDESRGDLGYANSQFETTVKPTLLEELIDAGHHVCQYEGKLVDFAVDGAPASATTTQLSVELLTETQLFGQKLVGPPAQSTSAKDVLDFYQLPLFRLDPACICPKFGSGAYWLRDTASDSEFVAVGNDGLPSPVDASEELEYRVMVVLHGYEE